MAKTVSCLLLIILSVIVVFFGKEIGIILQWIALAHSFFLAKLAIILPNFLLRATLALILIPLLLALIPAFVYWLFKRRMLPNYMAVVWVIWFILATLIVYR